MRWPGSHEEPQDTYAGWVRDPAVAGRFYPGDPDRLSVEIDGYLARGRAALAQQPPVLGARATIRLVGIVVPHAGTIYSGPTAGYAYAAIDPASVQRVVLLGPAHYVAVDGIGISSASAWRTPLGDVPLDGDLAADLRATVDAVVPADPAHAPEHSLEVQLPFLQRVLAPGWALVPLIVGPSLAQEVGAVIARCAALPSTLVVVSTDLSHYLDHESALAADARTIATILARDPQGLQAADACGRNPLRGLLAAAADADWAVRLLDSRTSGDTAGDRDRVVGYAAFAVTAGDGVRGVDGTRSGAGADLGPDPAVAVGRSEPDLGRIAAPARMALLALARHTIESALKTGHRPRLGADGWPEDWGPGIGPPDDPVLREPGAAFVTLRSEQGDLLGCIGSLTPHQSLVADVAQHAYDAAFSDPRFAPMTRDRAVGMVIDISVLSPTRAFRCSGYDDLLARLPVGSGVLVQAGRHRATFLPAVWEQLPEPAAFLAALWRKAGMPPGQWPSGTRIELYDSEEFAEG